jgi:ParB/RepB/Spo0J family partition protein
LKRLGFNNVLLEQIEPYLTRPIDDNFVNNLAAKIATHDYVAPLAVVPRGPKFLCAGGVHRFLALKKLKRPTAPCMIYEASDRELPIIALLDNELLPMTRIDKAKIIKKMLEEGQTEEKICDELKISLTQLNSLLVLLEIPEEHKDALSEYPKKPTPQKPLSSTHVEEIEKISDVNRAKRKSELYSVIIEKARKAGNGKTKIYSHRDVREIVTKSNAQPKKSIKEIADEIKKGHESTEDEGTVKKICPKCKGRGYIIEKESTESLEKYMKKV